MVRIDIRPVWRFRNDEHERAFDFQLVALLGRLEATSKLTEAAASAGVSYRHAWNLIADWEGFFGAPLVDKRQGRGSTLTPLGRRLLWAGRRAQARLEPDLDNLAAEFARDLNESLGETAADLVVHASHDFAIASLRALAAPQGIAMDLQYKGSFDALSALRRGECDFAGFHVPEGPLGRLLARRYAEGLRLDTHRLVAFATRTQGLIVRPGNPKALRTVDDLARPGVTMVNRQRGSGTRALLEFMISVRALDRTQLQGYDTEEVTHAAVAALIAGHQADAGFGIQAAAAQYGLGFVPLCRERYFLACGLETLGRDATTRLLQVLRGDAFRAAVAALPGYSAEGSGEVLDAFPADADAAA